MNSGHAVHTVEVARSARLAKSKDAELAELKLKFDRLQKARDGLADESVVLHRKIDQFQAQAAKLPLVKKQLQAFAQKQALLLEMLGEKEEELDELQTKLDSALALAGNLNAKS
jgi:predicted RNase H-like nuclease (RuvC/YqgF family)